MKSSISYPVLAGLLAGFSASLLAQEEPQEPSGWHFRLGPHVQFNYRLSIRDAQIPPSATAGTFDNGYVKPDSSGDTNTTRNWGFTDYPGFPSVGVGTSTLSLTRYDNVPRAGVSDGGSQTAFGGEISAAYEISRFRVWQKKEAAWGIQLGYGLTTFDSSASGDASSTVQQVTGVYGLATPGDILPPSPYNGQSSDRGPLLNLGANSITTNSIPGVRNSYSSKTSVDINTLKIGPWIDLPLAKKINLHVGVGYAAVYAQAEVDATDTLTGVTLAPDRQPPGAYHAARRNWEPGFFGSALLEYEFTDRWGAYLGIDFQHNSNLEFNAAGRTYEVDMGSTYGATAGVRFSF